MKRTNEPWRVSSHGYRYEIVSGEEIVAVTPYEIPPEERKLSNALLMAAAPEMLAALKGLVGAHLAKPGPRGVMLDVPHFLEQAEAAIAKAEGKEGGDHARN